MIFLIQISKRQRKCANLIFLLKFKPRNLLQTYSVYESSLTVSMMNPFVLICGRIQGDPYYCGIGRRLRLWLKKNICLKTYFYIFYSFLQSSEISTFQQYWIEFCFLSSWQKQSQKLTRVNLDRNIFSIKCGANIYFFPYGGLVQHVIHKFVILIW